MWFSSRTVRSSDNLMKTRRIQCAVKAGKRDRSRHGQHQLQLPEIGLAFHVNASMAELNEELRLRFLIRYAVRVLERQRTAYERLDLTLQIVSFIAGTAVFVSLIGPARELAIGVGIPLAIGQGVRIFARPADRARNVLTATQPYKDCLAKLDGGDVEGARKSLAEAKRQDDIAVWNSLKASAYNDVCDEIGIGSGKKLLSTFQRIVETVS